MKLLLLSGLPASGKSTFARELITKDPTYKRVNRDSLRDMIDAGKWSQNREKLIRKAQIALAELYIAEKFNIVVDDTNLSKSAQNLWQQFAADHKLTLETKFFDTPAEECIKRDLARASSVGQDVIIRMYNDYLKPKPEVYTPPADKPLAILCDIDGTIAHHHDRSAYDWSRVGEDSLDETVRGILYHYHDTGRKIILLSGRDGICRAETEDWLEHWGVPYDKLYMRAEGDNRKDFVIKRELFDAHIGDAYQVEFVLDDRKQVIRLWQSMGLKVLCCADDIDDDF